MYQKLNDTSSFLIALAPCPSIRSLSLLAFLAVFKVTLYFELKSVLVLALASSKLLLYFNVFCFMAHVAQLFREQLIRIPDLLC